MVYYGLVGLYLMVSCLTACDNSERYVITDTAPFYQTQIGYDPAQADAVIGAVREFAKRHRMDFLIARETLPHGDFNASANAPSLNLSAMHSGEMHDGVAIFAIARGTPTAEDRSLLSEFETDVRRVTGHRASL